VVARCGVSPPFHPSRPNYLLSDVPYPAPGHRTVGVLAGGGRLLRRYVTWSHGNPTLELSLRSSRVTVPAVTSAIGRARDRARDAYLAELRRLATQAELDEHRYALRYTLSAKLSRRLSRHARKAADAMATRMASCGNFASVQGRLCGHPLPDGSRARVLHTSCELPGCPICAPARAAKESAELAAKLAYVVDLVRADRELGHLEPCGVEGCDCHKGSPLVADGGELGAHVRFLTLTTRTGESAFQPVDVSTLRWNIRALKSCIRKLWRWLKSIGSKALYVSLELGERGMLHAHAVLVEPRWVAVEALSARWLEWTREAFGEGAWSVSVEAPYFTPRGPSGAKLRKADGSLVKAYGLTAAAVRELCKYTVSPKTPPHMAARLAVALHGAHRHWSYGLFRGVPAAVVELAQGVPVDSPCPICGCTEWVRTPLFPVEQLAESAALCRLDAVLSCCRRKE
jgi:hypothetical protein